MISNISYSTEKTAKNKFLIYFAFTNFVTKLTGEMTYIVIDTADEQSQGFLEYVKTLSFAKIQSGANVTTIKAMTQAKAGKTTKHKNAKELISFLNK